jgi:hypothetical protein
MQFRSLISAILAIKREFVLSEIERTFCATFAAMAVFSLEPIHATSFQEFQPLKPSLARFNVAFNFLFCRRWLAF